ncbi:hypothetical protein GE107_02325 [Cohnella sp. CFH 77786]|uniref:hypothetical protein n=1 Tax=Cohnella sp. CFH 77786 TaxID=2662265 RepID=UPI001C608D51|nr:hypothetical protein [Cohnella sp. CFH 77786]MBW5444900.1 hypothetical protein [Cohnella sp. CFH 77786]
MEGKRTYTVPVLLLILTVMAILLVFVASKLLLAQQKESKETGERLAQQYNYTLIFADRLREGADRLLRDESAANRIAAKKLLGEAAMAGDVSLGLLAEASSRASGKPLKEALKPLSEAMGKIMGEQSGSLYGVAEHEGPLTAAEKDLLAAVRDGAAAMKDKLSVFRPPTGDAGYRSMAAGAGWVDPAADAGRTLIDTAFKLK